MPHLRKPPPGASNKTFGVPQASFCSRDEEANCNSRRSLEVFGGGSQISSLLFSRTRSAWKDALQSAESHLPSTANVSQDEDAIRVVASISDTSLPSSQQQVTINRTEYASVISTAAPSERSDCEDDVSKWLASAETSGGGLVKASAPSVSRSSDFGSSSLDNRGFNHDACTQRMSDSSIAPVKSTGEEEWAEVLQLKRGKNGPGLPETRDDEAVSTRAAQWGYGVVLKPSDHRGSGSVGTERISGLSWTTRSSGVSSAAGKSSRTNSEESSACSGVSSIIPGVSKNVKEALASFQLAFVVCDALNPEYPILYASAGFFSMTGYTGKEIVGRNCRFLQGQYTDEKDVGMIRNALKEGKVYTGKLLNYKKDGTPFWNMLTISPIRDDGGRLIKYIGMQAEVSEGGILDQDGDRNSLQASVKKFLETEGQTRINNNSTDGGALSAPSASYKSSLDKSDVQRTIRSRYSLSSSRQSGSHQSYEVSRRSGSQQSFEVSRRSSSHHSFEASTNSLPSQEHQAAAAKLKAEVAALRAGAMGNGRYSENSVVLGGETGCKSSKRSTGLIKMFKKLGGRLSRSKRGPRAYGDEDRFVMDDNDDVLSDLDDEDLEDDEIKQPTSSSIYSGTLTAIGKQELGKTSESQRARRNSSQVCRSEDRFECRSTSDNMETTDSNGESPMRKDRISDSPSTPGSSVSDLPRSGIGYGRRSAQYPVAEGQAGRQGDGLSSDRRDRRHSLATITTAGSSINFQGKSQFCIVHPTAQ